MKRFEHLISAAFVLCLLASCGGKENPDNPSGGKAPATPTDVRLNRQTDKSLVYQWNSVSGADSYEWQLLQDGSQTKSGNTRNTNVIIDGLTKGVRYAFQVRSVVGEAASPWSAHVEGIPGGVADDGGNGNNGGDETDPTPDGPVSDAVYASFAIPAYEEDGTARAFPGAEGGGMYTTGGRGGKVIHVTNLNDSGPGSLRDALNQSGARTVVFDVAGVIELKSMLRIRNGDVTVAGQTAPGDGICLKNYTFRIDASNVIVRFIRCRMGDEAMTEDDAMQVMNHTDDSYKNIIIDHCSVSWSTDECASFYGMRDFTFQWNIVSESLRVSVHEKGTHGYGGIWGGNNATYHHNLLAHHDSRNPRIDHDYVSTQKGPVSIYNNVVYNWSGNTCYGGESSDKNGSNYRKYNFFNNYYKPGPATPSNHIWFLQPTTSCSNCGGTIIPGHFYMAGNIMHGQSALTSDNWKAGKTSPVGVYIAEGDVSKIKAGAAFTMNVQQNIHSGEGCLDPVLNYAGASLSRDVIDTRIAKETKDKTATYKGSKSGVQGLIDTQGDVGGWPEYAASADELARTNDSDGDGMPDWFEKEFGLDPAKNDGNGIWLDKNGRYTNLEMYLHYLVKDIVNAGNKGATYTKQ